MSEIDGGVKTGGQQGELWPILLYYYPPLFYANHNSALGKQRKQLPINAYRIGWICPLEVEYQAALGMLDERHAKLITQPTGDSNFYILGNIKEHNVVIVRPHSTGNEPAAMATTHLKQTFSRVEYILLVGIGGGVPTTPTNPDSPFYRVRLGDVVVGKQPDGNSGAVQYDRGKAEVGGKIIQTGFIQPPPLKI